MANLDRFLDDLTIGERWQGPPIEISEAAIIAFGNDYDPQPFHIDVEAGRASAFGSLIASGWHIAAVVMRAFVDSKPYGATPVVGLGVDQLRWLAPTRPGDNLTIVREVVEILPSKSNPGVGTVRSHVGVTNQAGVEVMRFDVLTRMPARKTSETV